MVEIELREHLVAAAGAASGVAIRLGTERSYPDIELAGPTFGDAIHAADVKCARRSKSGASLPSSIALYTDNTYFLWPQLKFSGILRPYADYLDGVARRWGWEHPLRSRRSPGAASPGCDG